MAQPLHLIEIGLLGGILRPERAIGLRVLPCRDAHGAADGAERAADQIVVKQIDGVKLPVQLPDALAAVSRLRERREQIGNELFRTLSQLWSSSAGELTIDIGYTICYNYYAV